MARKKIYIRVALLLLFVLSLLYSFESVSAATYYVAGDVGSDAYSSAQAQSTATPWQTIQKAANTMVAGDTVNVKGGITYAEGVTPANSGNATPGNLITYQSWAGTGTPIVDRGGVGGCFTVFKNFIQVSGFEIDHCTIGIMAFGTGNYFVNNLVHHSSSGSGLYIRNTSGNSYVYNNTVVDNVGTGINAWSGTGLVVRNNIIVGNTFGIGSDIGGLLIDHDYNLFYDNSGLSGHPEWGTDYMEINGIFAAPHDIHADPLFVDAANGDFSLQPNSPAINMGVDLTSSGVTTDIRGRARPNAGAYDIGAYEDPNLYVDGSAGLDTNNGSLTAPFLTIQKGADVATAGDNVNVRGGITYSATTCSNGVICLVNSGTASK